MQDAPRPGMIRLPVLQTVATTFRIFARAPIFFLSFSAVQLLPQPMLRHLGWHFGWATVLMSVAIAQVSLDLVQAVMLDRAARLIADRKAPLRASVRPGLRRAFPVLLASLLQILATGTGLVLLVVPGVFMMAALLVSGPLCLEGETPFASLAASWSATQGARLRIMGAIVLIWLPYAVIVTGVAAYTAIFAKPVPFRAYMMNGLVALFSAWITILAAVVHHALRPDKERAQIAAVFA